MNSARKRTSDGPSAEVGARPWAHALVAAAGSNLALGVLADALTEDITRTEATPATTSHRGVFKPIQTSSSSKETRPGPLIPRKPDGQAAVGGWVEIRSS